MKYFHRGSSALFITLIFVICSNSKAQHTQEAVKQEIATIYQDMGAAMQEGDAMKLASHFAKDVFFKLPGQQPVHSRDGVAKIHEGMIAQGMGIRPTTKELNVVGDIAYEIGTVDMLAKGNKVGEAYYLTVWKYIDGSWKISRDMVSAMPQPESSASH